MAKSQQTPERLALIQAHQQRAEAQVQLAAAEDAYQQALTTWAEASRDADALETRLVRLQERRDPGINQVRHQYAEEVAAARAAWVAEEARIQPVKDAYDATKNRIPEAQRALDAAQSQVIAAVRGVVAAEAEPVARAALARLHEAYAILLEAGPDLLAAIDKRLLPADLAREAEAAGGNLLRRATGDWPAYERRYRQSPWRSAAESLQDDPGATLPQAVC
jgi:hypothetical protein